MTEQTMIDRVALALKRSGDQDMEYLRSLAVAAIEAMRVPSDDMLEAGWGRGGTPADIWPAMIDAALSRNPT